MDLNNHLDGIPYQSMNDSIGKHMFNQHILAEPIKEKMISEVWDLIAKEVGDYLPLFVEQVVDEHFPSLINDEIADKIRQEISSALGELAYN